MYRITSYITETHMWEQVANLFVAVTRIRYSDTWTNNLMSGFKLADEFPLAWCQPWVTHHGASNVSLRTCFTALESFERVENDHLSVLKCCETTAQRHPGRSATYDLTPLPGMVELYA